MRGASPPGRSTSAIGCVGVLVATLVALPLVILALRPVASPLGRLTLFLIALGLFGLARHLVPSVHGWRSD